MKLHTRPKHFPSTSTAFGVINSTLTLSQHFSSIKAWGSVKVHRAVVLISDCIYKCVCLYLSIVWDLASSSSSWKWASSKCANAPKITHRHYSTVAVSRQCSVHYIKKVSLKEILQDQVWMWASADIPWNVFLPLVGQRRKPHQAWQQQNAKTWIGPNELWTETK